MHLSPPLISLSDALARLLGKGPGIFPVDI
jgi:hypothetical protein